MLFFEQVLAEARERGLTSDEHFTVDGTLVEAWAGLKSFKRKDGSDGQIPPDDPGNPTVNFHGEKRSKLRQHEVTPHVAKKIRYSAVGRGRCDTAGCPEWIGISSSPWPPTTWCGYATSLRRQHERTIGSLPDTATL